MIQLQLSPEALIERRKGVGGSDAPKIIRGEWYDPWLDKTGQVEPKAIMSDWNYAWRMATETLQMDWHEHKTGTRVIYRGEVIVSERYPFMRCTLDGWDDALHVPINAKQLSKWTKEAREWAIEHYTPQIVHEAIVTGAEYGLLSLLHGEKEPEILKIEVNPIFAADLICAEEAFWGYVQRREPPPDAPALKVPMLASEMKKLRTIDVPLNPDDPVFQAMMQRDNWLPECLEAMGGWATTKAAHDRNEILRKTTIALIPEDVGEVRRGRIKARRDTSGAIRMTLEKDQADGTQFDFDQER